MRNTFHLMMDPYTTYYVNQAGTGLVGFQGVRYQRGHGLFGRFFRGTLPGILKYLGKQAVSTTADIASDMIDGVPFKESAKARLRTRGKRIIDDVVTKGKEVIQAGGARKRRKSTSKTTANKKRKTIKGVNKQVTLKVITSRTSKRHPARKRSTLF